MIFEYILPSAFLLVLLLVLLLNLLTLPANWVMIALSAMWYFLHPNGDGGHGIINGMNLNYFITIIGLAIFGELIEYVTQAWGAKKYGSTTSGMFAGIIGAIIGAIFGMPFFLGFGALLGALAGGFIGCYVMEKINGKEDGEAFKAAKGALFGRFLGVIIKCGIGVVIMVMAFNCVWPGAFEPPPVSSF